MEKGDTEKIYITDMTAHGMGVGHALRLQSEDYEDRDKGNGFSH